MFKRLVSSLVCITFIFSTLQCVYAQDFSINQLPVPGTMVGLSAPFIPLALKGLIVNPHKPLEFQFLVDTGKGPQDTASIKEQSTQLVKYFLAGLTIPEGDLWVNLSPYEKDRIIPEALGQTELGRDLLAQDYVLKQLTASLIYPEKDLGKEFWSKVYKQAQEQFGTTNVPVNTFNKVWILPDQVQVFENGNAAYVTKATLKVMLDQDYLALKKHTLVRNDSMASVGANIVRTIILPEIKNEVNFGKNFAPLRQIYQALILAKWYKENIQNSLLDAIYTNKSKVGGLNLENPAVKEQIYQRYLLAYKKGVFNYIKEDPTPDGQMMPRKYFSGGVLLSSMPRFVRNRNPKRIPRPDGAMLIETVGIFHRVSTYVTLGLLGAASAGVLEARRRFLRDDGPKIDADKIPEHMLSKLAEPRASVRIAGITDDSDDFTKKDSYLRRYIQEPKVTHLERNIELLFLMNDLEAIFKQDKTLPKDYFNFLERMALDHSPDISEWAKQTIAIVIKLKKAKLEDIESLPLQHEILTKMNGLQGADLKQKRDDLIEYATIQLKGLIHVVADAKDHRTLRHNIPDWLPAAINKAAGNLDRPNTVTLEYLLYLAGDYRLGQGSNEIVDEVRNLLTRVGDDQEQFRGDAARALYYKNKGPVDFQLGEFEEAHLDPHLLVNAIQERRSLALANGVPSIVILNKLIHNPDSWRILGADGPLSPEQARDRIEADYPQATPKRQKGGVDVLMGILHSALAGLVDNDRTGKIETIRESVLALSTVGHTEFLNTWNRIFPAGQAINLTSDKIAELKDLLGKIVVDYAMSPGKPADIDGGIDLNQINVNRTGKKINVQFDPAQLNELMQGGFEGFVPEITNMTSISSPLPLMGVNLPKQEVLVKA